ncbi:hypothetical protein HPB51_001004 [Rhipicephalus microplus]|uniref:Large ribosomal subunit protein P1 n=1 Tax=Rhipicephalus microplus TaxID=6941 RepID=A0A9J6DEF9_RHIMP|nr:hypothetical protein HPB51_001004 [Rhipicephalus microplus]
MSVSSEGCFGKLLKTKRKKGLSGNNRGATSFSLCTPSRQECIVLLRELRLIQRRALKLFAISTIQQAHQVTMPSNDELACVYGALILQDDEIAVTAEKISTILKAAGVEVEPYWPGLFAKALEGLDLKSLISNVGSGVGSGPAAGAAPAAAAAAAAPAAGGKAGEWWKNTLSRDLT